jgi:hypothetical protein
MKRLLHLACIVSTALIASHRDLNSLRELQQAEKRSKQINAHPKRLQHYQTHTHLYSAIEEASKKKASESLPQCKKSPVFTLDLQDLHAEIQHTNSRTTSPEPDPEESMRSLSTRSALSDIEPATTATTPSSQRSHMQTSQPSSSRSQSMQFPLSPTSQTSSSTPQSPQFLSPLSSPSRTTAKGSDELKRKLNNTHVIANHVSKGTAHTTVVRSLDQLLALPIPNNKLPPLH